MAATATSATPARELADLYLELLAASLTGTGSASALEPARAPAAGWRRAAFRGLERLLAGRALELARRVDPEERAQGRDRPASALTMVGLARLRNLRDCIAEIVDRGVPGDLIETGVWRGGASIFMRGALRALGGGERTVWLADSFEGLPRPDAARFPHDAGDPHWTVAELAVGEEEVRENFRRYGLLDGRVRFLPGWFRETLPSAPVERLALLRLDGDMYESTMVALEALYPRLSSGGYVVVDDYGAVAGCRAAVDEFRAANSIDDRLQVIDWTGVCWRRS